MRLKSLSETRSLVNIKARFKVKKEKKKNHSFVSSSALSGTATVDGGDRSVHSCRPENPQTQHGKAPLGER